MRFSALSGLLVRRADETVMFFHSSLREWLIRRGDRSQKFLCEPRQGHAAIAFRMSRQEAPLSPDKTLELGHHILKVRTFYNNSLWIGKNCVSTRTQLKKMLCYRPTFTKATKTRMTALTFQLLFRLVTSTPFGWVFPVRTSRLPWGLSGMCQVPTSRCPASFYFPELTRITAWVRTVWAEPRFCVSLLIWDTPTWYKLSSNSEPTLARQIPRYVYL